MTKREFIEESEDVAFMGLKAMREYLAYMGTTNKEYLQRAKIGAQAVQAYTRHYASLTNREALRITQERQARELAAVPVKELPPSA
jgi:hypothetical protein